MLTIDTTSETPAAAHAKLWSSPKGAAYQKKTAFLRRLATELRQGKVVVFHYDGDTPWEKRHEGVWPAVFAQKVRLKLRHLETMNDRPLNHEHLIDMVPYYLIESWLYQATDRAIQISQEQHGGTDVALFQT